MYIHVRVQPAASYYSDGPDSKVKVRLEDASGEPCLVVPYERFNLELVRSLRPRAIAMSGFGGHFQDHELSAFAGMDEVLHKHDIPTICFCGSHQLLGFCFEKRLSERSERLADQPMRKLAQHEHWPRRAGPGCDISDYFVAEGFFPIRKVKDDPLFAGLPDPMLMCCSHYCEVKELPEGFELLATSDHCRIEAMRHKTRPLYGTQFHPEAFNQPFFDGKTLLKNFASIVDRFWAER
jgi:hypothetical protein